MRLISCVKRDPQGVVEWPYDRRYDPNNKADVVLLRLIRLIDAYGEITGYDHFYQLDMLLMLAYWYTYDGMKDSVFGSREKFQEWFLQQGTYPDYIRRARERLVQPPNSIVMVPDHVRRDAAQKQLALGGHFKGI
jgi:hypothetical protein